MSINLCPVLRSLSRSNWKHNSGCELRIGSQRKKKQKAEKMNVRYLMCPGGVRGHITMHSCMQRIVETLYGGVVLILA
jgi:hypothetical protein